MFTLTPALLPTTLTCHCALENPTEWVEARSIYIQPIQNGRILPAIATLAVLARDVPLVMLLESDVLAVEVVEVTAVLFTPVAVLLAPPPTPVPVDAAVLVVFEDPLPAEVDVGAVQFAVKNT